MSGNELIVQVKDNQSGLVERLKTCIAETASLSTDRTCEQARNRHEERTAPASDPPSGAPSALGSPPMPSAPGSPCAP